MATTTPPTIHPFAPGDPETRSADLVAEHVAQLRALFPSAFGDDGRVRLDVLRELLGEAVDEREERYGLSWHGKRQARRLALAPSAGTLRPAPEESVDWDTTRNLVIEGDNLEVLKLLQKSYAGKVKLIYIDPPYNTGKDFVYPDDYRDSLGNYLALTGQVDGEGRKLASNTEASGRFHTDWLNMMYPRLMLARHLLAHDGAIFVSIDDHEVQNLRAIMDEVFGADNFVATVIWHKMDSPKNTAVHFSEDHDYVMVYARVAEDWRPGVLPRTPEMVARYKNPDNDPRGPWLLSDLAARNYYSAGRYEIRTPSGRVIAGPPAGSYWRVSREKFAELDADNRIWWGSDGDNRPGIKRFLSEVKEGVTPQTYWHWKDVGSTRHSKQELSQVLGASAGEDLFITPKPVALLSRILQIGGSTDSIVFDFFAGSGTTAHAVLSANARDGGTRRFITVQLPEPTGDARYPTLADLTRKRIELAGHKVKAEHPLFTGDVGFRVFKLAPSNVRAWSPDAEDLTGTLLAHADHLVPGRTEQDVLFELLLKLGLELTVPIETVAIAGHTVHAVGGGVLLACLAPSIARDAVEPLAEGIAALHARLAPVGESTVVFRDAAFTDDVAKANLAAILHQRGLGNLRSL